jgi:hypothetical protein
VDSAEPIELRAVYRIGKRPLSFLCELGHASPAKQVDHPLDRIAHWVTPLGLGLGAIAQACRVKYNQSLRPAASRNQRIVRAN